MTKFLLSILMIGTLSFSSSAEDLEDLDLTGDLDLEIGSYPTEGSKTCEEQTSNINNCYEIFMQVKASCHALYEDTQLPAKLFEHCVEFELPIKCNRMPLSSLQFFRQVSYDFVRNCKNSGSDIEYWTNHVPFQRIEAGTFTMGSPEDEPGRENDENQVQVTISKPFEIMKYEVTQSQWVRVMGNDFAFSTGHNSNNVVEFRIIEMNNPSNFRNSIDCEDHTAGMCPNNPVEGVSWDDVQKFIKKLNESLGLINCNIGGKTVSSPGCYRLPTEAEWEYAVRAGTNTAYFFGDDVSDLGDYAWYSANSSRKTYPVGMKKPNPFGLYDVYGNVAEYVQDVYSYQFPDAFLAESSVNLIKGVYKKSDFDLLLFYNIYYVVRGGHIKSSNNHSSWLPLRSASRNYSNPRMTNPRYPTGFRLVKTL